MGRKNKPRVIPKQNIRLCRTICVCQLTMVMSCVAMIYLTFAIYVPSYHEFQEEEHLDQAICQTLLSVNNCSWVSCGEWCLTSNSGFCPQINATVRQYGTDVTFQNCSIYSAEECNEVSTSQYSLLNCNDGNKCGNLTGQFICKNGWCKQLDSLYQCKFNISEKIVVDADRDNIKLNGFFLCNKSRCNPFDGPHHCNRICNTIKTNRITMLIMEENSVVSANCLTAVAHNRSNGNLLGEALTEPVNIWNASEHGVLITNCASMKTYGERIEAKDCINGTILNDTELPAMQMNFTQFWKIYAESHRLLDTTNKYLPSQQSLTIYNTTQIFINLEGCVNTLRGECTEFFERHGSNGSNNTAPSRYPCYYNRHHSQYAIIRFDLKKTYKELIIAATVPTTLFVLSCIFLCVITQSVQVGDDAKMRCKYFRGSCGSDQEDSIPAKKRNTENEPILSPSSLQSPVDNEPETFHEEMAGASLKPLDSPGENKDEKNISKSTTAESKFTDERPLVML